MGALGAHFVLGQAGHAMTAVQAETLVTKVVSDINKVIASGKSDAAMIKDFEKIFETYSDVDTMARMPLVAMEKKQPALKSNSSRKYSNNMLLENMARASENLLAEK